MINQIISNNTLRKAYRKIRNKIRSNSRVLKAYKEINFFASVSIPEITPFRVRKSRFDFERINILLPSINREHLFGGISTALILFDEIIKKMNKDTRFRIIITDDMPNKKAVDNFNSYRLLSCDDDISERFQLLPFCDRYQKTIPVTRNDKFIATAWWTAHNAQDIITQQSKLYDQDFHKMIYLIQDFEPCFYNWSDRYVLANVTYNSSIPTIAVFNSSFLKKFFNDRGYQFEREYFFEPRMNEKLKRHFDLEKMKKKKQILIYGRPSVPRNGFILIIEALKIFTKKQDDIHEWKFISVGEQHPDVEIGAGVILKSLGKLSLDDYAGILKESAIGISLMISPHPSYPPLEMAHFGILTITNSFANKDLSKWHENITSVEILTPQNLYMHLSLLVEKYKNNSEIGLQGESFIDYASDNMGFDFIENLLVTFKS
ncbi:MAG: hypothetical protein IMY71_14070 [Bacteroidetes bacterium]|nr:hypothetical protein [Bacteroidota bacterium]